MQAVADSDQRRGSINFDHAFIRHVGFSISNAVRSFWLGITGARLVLKFGDGVTRRYYQHLTRMSAAFALVTDVCMLMLGGALKRKEKLSGRLADILSQLYMSSAVLKRYEDQGRPADDAVLVHWCCQLSLYRIQQSLDELLANFPSRGLAWMVRRLVFPFGRRWRHPDDRLGHQIASLLLTPSTARDRLTAGVYTTTDPDEAIGAIEQALVKVIAAESVEKRISAALRSGILAKAGHRDVLEQAIEDGIINGDEAALVRDADLARRAVIMVDDFPADYWSKPA